MLSEISGIFMIPKFKEKAKYNRVKLRKYKIIFKRINVLLNVTKSSLHDISHPYNDYGKSTMIILNNRIMYYRNTLGDCVTLSFIRTRL